MKRQTRRDDRGVPDPDRPHRPRHLDRQHRPRHPERPGSGTRPGSQRLADRDQYGADGPGVRQLRAVAIPAAVRSCFAV